MSHSPSPSPPSGARSSTTPSTTTSTQSAVAATSSRSNPGTIAGCVIGGVVLLVLLVLGTLLYLRIRKRRRTPPSSEFMNSLKDGATPVLRLDSALAEKGGGPYTHYPAVPLPFMQNSYHTSPPMQNMRFPDEMMVVTDIPSGRLSVETPLRPQRLSSQRADDSFVAQHRPSTSVGSRRELWGSDTEIVSSELHPDYPRISSDEPSTRPLHLSHLPTPLQPLRRQPDLENWSQL